MTESKKSESNKHDVLSKKSDSKGLLGLFETFIRRFRTISFLILLMPVVFLCLCALGLSLAPALAFFYFIQNQIGDIHPVLHYIILGLAFATSYMIYGVSLLFVVPLLNFIFPFKVKPFRGIWYSVESIPWYVHNAFTYLVRYTFLEFITPSPLNILYFKMMGMKIGKGVVINTSNISDPCLIELGDYVTIGGSATLFAHYGQKGFLVISPIKIKKGATIGLKSSIMGGVEVGENSVIRPHNCLLPKTIIDDNQVV